MKGKNRIQAMDDWLNLYPPDRNTGAGRELLVERGKSKSPYLNEWHRAEPSQILDLHGLTGREAEEYLASEIREAWKRGARKLRIIHGKGLHSKTDAVLPSVVDTLLTRSDLVLRHGRESRENGGNGATWVILKGK